MRSKSSGRGTTPPTMLLGGELLQLCAFTSGERGGRIARPSWGA